MFLYTRSIDCNSQPNTRPKDCSSHLSTSWKLGAHQFQMKLKKQKNNLWFETVVDLCPLNLLILLKTLKKYT
ncbi:hypothetical protein HanXRQr2_Chr12g0520811 [Helianthus annuus]|uniref:Uncharacterized protein n=1 Tax=Helianthus annuus TaxID=4232 RepID=A0A251SYN4_HELAN|nr:hypothetical protein HanXRQr2_Chr12g0520811 [Helianthus annuus]KAJ0861022.1 hypothetical protein HanPSC8_Chr12g0502041 [Helianthus annuus]